LSSDSLPAVDMIFCRDCLVHFSYKDVLKALGNIKRSGARYLVTTTFPGREDIVDIETGAWRPLDLCAAPFNLPPPIRIINERCTEGDNQFTDKSLGVWQIADLRLLP